MAKFAKIAALLLVCSLLIGCETSTLRPAKSRGVYTIGQTTNGMPINSFSYGTPQTVFSPDEVPVAVVAGYDGQDVNVELYNLTISQSVQTNLLKAVWGQASLQPLMIEKTGEYEVRLLSDGVVQDSSRFWATRNSASVLNVIKVK